MFIDMVGSTALATRLDPEDMRDVISRYQDAVSGVIARFGGHVAKFMGDGVLAYFGWPRVREDEVEIALRAGLQALEVVARIEVPGGEQLSARIGCASGWVVIGDLVGTGEARERTVVGETPNLAARLQAAAAPGQMVISAATAQLAGNRFTTESMPPLSLKGFNELVEAVRVLGERAAVSRFEVRAGSDQRRPLFGRNAEVSLLMERWQASMDGEGQAALLVGEAGIGKSRITAEVLDRLHGSEHTRVRFQCSPYYAETPLWPVVQQIRRAAGLAGSGDLAGVAPAVADLEGASDDAPSPAARLRALLALGNDDPESQLPAIADLLDVELAGATAYQALSASEKRSRLHHAMIEQLVGLSRKHPTLVILEDAHWADPSTLELFDLLLGAIARERILVLITSRPENEPVLDRPNITRLALTRLGSMAVAQLVKVVMAGAAPPAIVEQIAARTDGIPLYIEELTKAVMEARNEATDHQPAPIPASLHDILMARLDRLEGVREVAQVAACIGREFERGLLLEASDLGEDRVDKALDRLVEAELIYRRQGTTDPAFIFKHALVRDAAYSSPLRSKRRAIHSSIVAALDARGDAPSALIGQHASEAGDTSRAVAAFTQAGHDAAKRSANEEALSAFERALALVGELSEPEAETVRTDLLVAMCVPLIAVKGYAAPEVEAVHREALARVEAAGENEQRFKVMRGLWNCIFDKGELRRSRQLAEALVEFATASGRGDWLRLSNRAIGSNLLLEGRLAESREAVETVLACSELWSREETLFEHGEDPDAVARQYFAWVSTLEGRADTGLKLAEKALEDAEALSLPIAGVFARSMLNKLLYFRRDKETCLESARIALAIAQERHYPFWTAYSRVCLGWASSYVTHDVKCLDEVKAGIASWTATGASLHISTLNTMAADAAVHLGCLSDADEFLAEALAFADKSGESFMLAELHRLQALALRAKGQDGEVEPTLRKSLAIAAEQGARLFELRAALDLARLQSERDEDGDGRARLEAVLGSFTEGADTPDQREARAFLSGLSA